MAHGQQIWSQVWLCGPFCFRVFFIARLFASSLRSCPRRKLFPRFLPSPLRISLPLCLLAGIRRCGDTLLLPIARGRHCGARSHPHHVAILGPGGRTNHSSHPPPGFTPPIPHVALSSSSNTCIWRLLLCAIQAG